MEHVSIIPQLKKKNPSDLEGTIIIRGFYARRPVTSKSTGHRVRADHWDSHLRRVIDQAPNAQLINMCIQLKVQRMRADLMKKEIGGHAVNRTAVFKAVKGMDESKDFLAFCRQRIKEDYESEETIRSYESDCTKLEAFKDPISFADIDFLFLTNYRTYMLQVLGNDPNTVWKSFKFINTMINKAIKIGGIIHENPFKEFDRGKYVQKARTYLELSDCDRIEKLTADEAQPVIIRRVAIWFLLMAYSGMRFSDAMRFDPQKHIKDGCIVMDYQKFQTNVNNYMWGRLTNIMELVKLYPLKLSNQKFNMWLKMVQALAGVEVSLSSHLGRHTLGGFLAEMEVPRETARAILGHKDIKSTDIYYHQKSTTVHRGMAALDQLKNPG